MLAADECFLSIYGTLRRHSWLDANTGDENGHSLFDSYGESLGWGNCSGSLPAVNTVLWYLYDAGWNWSDEAEHHPDHLLWVHTGLSNLAKQTGLPIFQMNVCAERVLQRVGIVTLTGAQMVLPVRKAPARQPQPLRHILGVADPARSVDIQFEIEGGEDDTCVRNADRIISAFNSATSWQGIQFHNYQVLRDNSYLLLEPGNMTREGWLGDSVGRITGRASVPEFSLDIFSYICAQLAWECQQLGVRGSVLVTVRL